MAIIGILCKSNLLILSSPIFSPLTAIRLKYLKKQLSGQIFYDEPIKKE
jgi:hypothetical protein